MMRQSNSLLNEHWKRKQRLKGGGFEVEKEEEEEEVAKENERLSLSNQLVGILNDKETNLAEKKKIEFSERLIGGVEKERIMIDVFRSKGSKMKTIMLNERRINCHLQNSHTKRQRENLSSHQNTNSVTSKRHSTKTKTNLNCNGRSHLCDCQLKTTCNSSQNFKLVPTSKLSLITFTTSTLELILLLFFFFSLSTTMINCQSLLQSDPRPTIYSGQVSFGLLLSAHSSLGAELSTSASHQVVSMLRVEPPDNFTTNSLPPISMYNATLMPNQQQPPRAATGESSALLLDTDPEQFQFMADSSPINGADVELLDSQESGVSFHGNNQRTREKRQIFERTGQHRRQPTGVAQNNNNGGQQVNSKQLTSTQQVIDSSGGVCSQVNANALYAGMGAIWASHQANLVGDSHLAIGTYVYDSCNDLDVGQRQSVRIVSNLNAFQQTTCESPRGSPISLTIAHGDNQLRAIQLLTSFRVPVITTKEHFALEDYNQLTRDQKRFLFTTAPSSRHLAVGALRFSKRIVSKSVSSPNLRNHLYKMSSKNGLIVISRNLPARFITYLTEMIPNHVNYEMLQSNQPIDQIRSVEALESIFIKNSASESKLVLSKASPPPVSAAAAATSGNSQTYAKSFSGSNKTTTTSSSTKPKHTTLRQKRYSQQDPDSQDSSSSSDNLNAGDFEASEDTDNSKMLSPTILMFITPSEAIDLVTRLRNDLAEVSRYYSLIVTTREDISPALKTIFHRGGSRLCSGKAFYTISPKPDDIGEFSRYFRDTVQMEGESSDHPLVCEYAKYQASTKVNSDLDDISTEPVIKAVWSAAAAFKSVHRRECASLAASTPTSGSETTSAGSATGASAGSGGGPSRTMSSRQSSKSAHAECLVKMNKNMSNLVQRALKRLDVTINSTGLQSLDGFRLKFDDLNELMTNKFSIKYINKECEITEIGQYSGYKDSSLRIDEETLVKSLEGSMPEPWPVHVKPIVPPTQAPTTTSRPTTTEPLAKESSNSAASDNNSDSVGNDSNDSPITTFSGGKGRRKSKRGGSDSDDRSAEAEEDTTPTIAGELSEIIPSSGDLSNSSKRNKKRSKSSDEKPALAKRKSIDTTKKKLVAAPVTAMGGKNILPGVTDTVAETTTTTTNSDQRTTRALPTTPSTNSAGIITATPVTTTSTTTQKPMRKLKPFPSPIGTTIKDWLPAGEALTTANSNKIDYQTTTRTPKYMQTESVMTTTTTTTAAAPKQLRGSHTQVPKKVLAEDSLLLLDELMARPTTQAPIQSTLPESDGNTDLDQILPSSSNKQQQNRSKSMVNLKLGRATNNQVRDHPGDYATSSSISTFNKQPSSQINARQPYPLPSTYQSLRDPPVLNMSVADADLPIVINNNRNNQDYLRDLNVSPIPLSATSRLPNHQPHEHEDDLLLTDEPQSSESKTGRFRIRSNMRWIYSSWYALSILGANICGALLTLYVLTFLLMRNCDGSLDRDNQGIRSMHLLAIIVVFFGSTLFLVYPTPGLCLLRTSWHNFALVMLFGSLLLQAMQTRSLGSLGLGGRPNRLNQFLTLIFMVGVQVAFEFQRWKYESANYMNFVNQYFASSSGDNKKFMILNGAISDQFNPLNSFNDQVTPVNIQISEHYQNLLQDYCLQQVDDFLQSQVYLCLIVGLLVMFSASNRRKRRLTGASAATNHHKLKSTLTSGQLVASQHEANLNLSPSHHFQSFASANSVVGSQTNTGNLFLVTIISAFTYSISFVLHIYGQNTANRDLISSLTMVLIAFTTLIGIFLPILLQIHRYDSVIARSTDIMTSSSSSSTVPNQHHLHNHHHPPSTGTATDSLKRTVINATQQLSSKLNNNPQMLDHHHQSPSSPSTAFTMFPEFAPTGLRRPASIGGDTSSSGAGSRRTFAETKESRRNMGAALANLGPTADSLRSMGFYTSERQASNRDNNTTSNKLLDPSLLNLKLNLSAIDEPTTCSTDNDFDHLNTYHTDHNHYTSGKKHGIRDKTGGGGEKRLIMLDVDPCCPRHGVGATGNWCGKNVVVDEKRMSKNNNIN